MSRRTVKVLEEMIRGVERALVEAPAYEDLGFIMIAFDPHDGSFNVVRTDDIDDLDYRAMLRQIADNRDISKRRMDA